MSWLCCSRPAKHPSSAKGLPGLGSSQQPSASKSSVTFLSGVFSFVSSRHSISSTNDALAFKDASPRAPGLRRSGQHGKQRMDIVQQAAAKYMNMFVQQKALLSLPCADSALTSPDGIGCSAGGASDSPHTESLGHVYTVDSVSFSLPPKDASLQLVHADGQHPNPHHLQTLMDSRQGTSSPPPHLAKLPCSLRMSVSHRLAHMADNRSAEPSQTQLPEPAPTSSSFASQSVRLPNPRDGRTAQSCSGEVSAPMHVPSGMGTASRSSVDLPRIPRGPGSQGTMRRSASALCPAASDISCSSGPGGCAGAGNALPADATGQHARRRAARMASRASAGHLEGMCSGGSARSPAHDCPERLYVGQGYSRGSIMYAGSGSTLPTVRPSIDSASLSYVASHGVPESLFLGPWAVEQRVGGVVYCKDDVRVTGLPVEHMASCKGRLHCAQACWGSHSPSAQSLSHEAGRVVMRAVSGSARGIPMHHTASGRSTRSGGSMSSKPIMTAAVDGSVHCIHAAPPDMHGMASASSAGAGNGCATICTNAEDRSLHPEQQYQCQQQSGALSHGSVPGCSQPGLFATTCIPEVYEPSGSSEGMAGMNARHGANSCGLTHASASHAHGSASHALSSHCGGCCSSILTIYAPFDGHTSSCMVVSEAMQRLHEACLSASRGDREAHSCSLPNLRDPKDVNAQLMHLASDDESSHAGEPDASKLEAGEGLRPSNLSVVYYSQGHALKGSDARCLADCQRRLSPIAQQPGGSILYNSDFLDSPSDKGVNNAGNSGDDYECEEGLNEDGGLQYRYGGFSIFGRQDSHSSPTSTRSCGASQRRFALGLASIGSTPLLAASAGLAPATHRPSKLGGIDKPQLGGHTVSLLRQGGHL